MKFSRDGWLPQIELGPRIGGLKVLYQRAGSLVFQPITMISAMGAAWSTTPALQGFFAGSFLMFVLAVAVFGVLTMGAYYVAILPAEQRFNQVQSQRTERSPLKRDTEAILDEVREGES
jgi:hypothetical protein